MALATSPSVCPDHSVTVSSMFISQDASWAATSRVDEDEVRSRCSCQDSTYPSKTHWAPWPAGVTTMLIGV